MWQKLKVLINHGRVPLITAPSIAFLVSAGSFFGVFQLLEGAVRDEFFRLRSLEEPEDAIVVVTIDETDIAAVGDWPITDAVLAELLEKLRSLEPRAIGMDLYRNLPEEPGYEELIAVFRSTPNLIGIENILGARVPPPPILKELGQVALANVIWDRDRKVRRGLLSAQDSEDGGRIKLTLPTQLALMYLEAEGITLEAIDPEQQKLKLGRAIFVPLKAGDAGYRENDDLGGYQILMNWRGSQSLFPTISMTEVLEGRVEPEQVRDRIVLIGSIADSTNDFFETPYDSLGFAQINPMPGVVVHANLASQIIRAAMEGRPLLQGSPRTWEAVWIAIWSGVGAILSWSLENTGEKRGKLPGIRTMLGGFGSGGLLIGGAYLAFLGGILLPVVSPLAGFSLSAIVTANLYKQWKLEVANNRLAAANQQLEDYSRNLEVKVEERTAQLKKAKEEAETARAEADSANSAKSEFLSNMSHELRTPLNGILGYAQIFQQEKSFNSKQQDGVNVIYQCGTHLLNLINDILDLSKIEARKMELYLGEIHLPTFLQGVVEMCRIKAEQKGISFNYRESAPLPNIIIADEKRLRQVLINLLGNAIKFTDNGEVNLKVDLLTQDQSKENRNYSKEVNHQKNIEAFNNNSQLPTIKIRFQVEDTGVGMSSEQVAKIFTPFEQVGEKSRRSQGTGLGLSISQKIAAMMGSKIQIASELGNGSIFWFDAEFPVLASSQGYKTNNTDIGAIAGYAGKKRKILVVDNTRENRDILRNLLEVVGFVVVEAVNGDRGLERVFKEKPDLVVTDLAMPELDGFEMVRRLRAKPEFQKLPIVASSARAYQTDREKIAEAGCNDFLPKPIVAEHLLAMLQTHLGLEWIYEKNETVPISSSESEVDSSPEEIVPPPAPILNAIYELAAGGLFFEIEKILGNLEKVSPEFIPFNKLILNWSMEFEGEKIMESLQAYMSDRSV
ncbi:MAG: CHASE2 domain-containing protein [Oscillatoria sp. SIO1A7]|nr:CHASE2 domain-containing protein [Oscillatoria sp. SIO1A7]